ncbi:MAG: hypothetical protein Q8K62_08675 [Thiobacillus sp.]|nr:hypothetical protein [Thiobacillus sp.]
MSESPLLSKMDALLKKHRGGNEIDSTRDPVPAPLVEPGPPPDAWLPVLTDLIERGTPPVVAQAAAVPAADLPVEADVPTAEIFPAAEVNDTLTEQLMSELAPRLSEVMEKQVSAELRKSLDQTVANLLSQLDVSVREIVREAVAEKLKPPRDPSS